MALKMRGRITLGFGAVIGLLLVVSVVAVIFLRDATTSFVQYRDWARDSNITNAMTEHLLMSQLQVKEFIIRGTEAEVDGFQEWYGQFRGDIEIAQREITNPERAALVDKIDAGSITYSSHFEDVIRYQAVRDEHVANVNAWGSQLEQHLTAILTSAADDNEMIAAYEASLATRNLLLARLYVVKFLDDNAASSAERVRSEFALMDEHMAILDQRLENTVRRGHMEAAADMTGQYIASFEQIVSAINGRNEAVANLIDVAGPQMIADAERVVLSAQTDQDELGLDLQARIQLALVVVLITSGLAVLAGAALALVITRGILRQLGEDPSVIEDVARRVSMGDLTIQTDNDATGVYKSVQEMVRALRSKAEIIDAIARKDLTMEVEKASDADALGESLIIMRDSLHTLLTQTRQAVDQVASGADQVSSASQELSQGATEQASTLEEISASVNQINGQSRRNADTSTEASEIAQAAAASAKAGNNQMIELRSAMSNIATSSDEIKKVVKVIDDIAFQINLLALNANVEAARAGKYGKGFAVVAEEVRNLAVRSAAAVKETTAMVEESVKNIENGNALTDTTASQLQEIVDGATRVSGSLEEIAASSKEQALAIDQITEGLTNVDQVTQGNTASAEESASASEELASQAAELRSQITQFRLRTDEERAFDAPAAKLRIAPIEQPRAATNGHREQTFATAGDVEPSSVIELDDDGFDRF